MMLIVVDRIIALTWRMNTKGQLQQSIFITRFGSDLPIYAFTIITIALWMQWHYLYKIIENFNEALQMLEKKTHFKALLIIFILITCVQVTEAVMINKNTQDWEDLTYHKLAGYSAGLLAFFTFIVAIFYGLLYYWFLRLINKSEGELDHMRRQVHGFFIFMIVIVCSRVTNQILTTYYIYRVQSNSNKNQWTLGAFFYINATIEVLLNLMILYYRIRT